MNLSKANKYTTILVTSAFVLLLLLMEIESSKGDVSGPQVQGGVILFLASVAVLLSAIFGFPFIYKISEKISKRPMLGFWGILLCGILSVSVFLTLILATLGFGFNIEALIRMCLIQVCVFGLAILPLAMFWCVIAWKA